MNIGLLSTKLALRILNYKARREINIDKSSGATSKFNIPDYGFYFLSCIGQLGGINS